MIVDQSPCYITKILQSITVYALPASGSAFSSLTCVIDHCAMEGTLLVPSREQSQTQKLDRENHGAPSCVPDLKANDKQP